MRLWHVFLVVAAMAVPRLVATQDPPEAPQVFRGGTTLIPLDVRVVDRTGKAVTDLTKDDFVVTENGVRQTIRHFSTQGYSPAVPEADAALKARTERTSTLEPQNRRVFLIVLGNGAFRGPAKAREGVLHFVRERLLPQDLVAVIAWNRTTEFTTDHDKIAAFIERFGKAEQGIDARLHQAMGGLAAVYGAKAIPPVLQKEVDAVFGGPEAGLDVRTTEVGQGPNASRIRADRDRAIEDLRDAARREGGLASESTLDDFVQQDAQSMQDLGKLYAAIDYLRHFDGEKQIIFLSETGLILPRSEDDQDLAVRASDARVVMNFIHTGGVQTGGLRVAPMSAYRASQQGLAPERSPMQPLGPMTWQRQTARQVSTLTGGGVSIAGYARNALDSIDQGSRFEYLIGYYPANGAQDSKFRRVRVTVNRPGVVVSYRHGYYAAPPESPLDHEHMLTYNRVVAAASYPDAVPDIAIRGTARASKPPEAAAVALEITIDPSRLAFKKVNGRNVSELELLAGCLDGRDNILSELWKHVQLTYTDARLAEVKTAGVPITVPLPLNGPVSAAKKVKVVVYDYAADLVGSAMMKVQ
jgi:VWFA-related protein